MVITMKQTLVIILVVFLVLSSISESDAWRRRRAGLFHKRNHNDKTHTIKTSQDDEEDKTKKHRFHDDKDTYEDADLL